MARRHEKRYVWVDVTSEDVSTIDRGRVKILTNPPMKAVNQLNKDDIASVTRFFSEVIVDWEGFDLPCSAEGFGELDTEETQELSAVVIKAITTPQSATSDNG